VNDMSTPAAAEPGARPGWVDYDELPDAAKEAIRNWTTLASAGELEAHARTSQWQLEQVPAEAMKARVMSADPDLMLYGGTFATYHSWYLGAFRVPDHGASRWPVIEHPGDDTCEGYLDDGWHRLHAYLRAGDTSIPLLRHRRRPGPSTH